MQTRRLVPLTLCLATYLAGCGGAATAPSAAPPSTAAPAKPASAPASASPAAAKPASSAAPSASKPQASVVAAASNAQASAAPSKLTPLKSAFVVLSTHTLPSWIADSEGFFKQQGLDVQFSYIQGSTVAVPALAAGEIGMLHATPAASVQAQLKGQDTVVLAQHIGTADNRLVAGAGISSIADLKGKTMAVSKAGTVSDLVAREMLRRNNLVPDKDVKITFIGEQPGMVAALQNNTIQAALVDVPFYLVALKKGAHVVYNTLDLHYPYPVDGVLSTRKFVREQPAIVDSFLKAYVQGLRFERANPQKSQEILGKQTKETDPELLAEAYRDEMEILIDKPVPSLDSIETILPLFDGQGKNPRDFVDAAPIQKALQELG